MKKLLNAIFLISGTAIGAGLIALPLTSVNLGTNILVAIIFFMVFVAYKTSMMTVDLNAANGKSASIVDLSRSISGEKAFIISMISFYTLSFSLLSVYFSGIANTLSSFFDFNDNFIIIICGFLLFFILNLKYSAFSKLNSILVVSLLVIILSAIIQIHTKETSIMTSVYVVPQSISASEIIAFLPIIFTSFGVQNICSHIFESLNKDRGKIKIAFLIGILIPAVVYIIWNSCVFENILAGDVQFFQKLQNHQISVGELIQFLCKSSENMYMEIFFKILSLFAIITSAVGIGLGLKKSIEESVTSSKYMASAVVCGIPVALCMAVPNAFINILSFGGMIATVFVIFVPYYLLKKRLKQRMDFGDDLCLVFGVMIVLCELVRLA